jgi:hypothetical protein
MQTGKVSSKQAASKAGRRLQPAEPARPEHDDEVGRLVSKLKALGPEAEEFARRLVVVNDFHLWKDCPRAACRRARKCRDDDVACFDERRAALKRQILQFVVMLLCTADISSDEFYDYLDEVTEDTCEDGGLEP